MKLIFCVFFFSFFRFFSLFFITVLLDCVCVMMMGCSVKRPGPRNATSNEKCRRTINQIDKNKIETKYMNKLLTNLTTSVSSAMWMGPRNELIQTTTIMPKTIPNKKNPTYHKYVAFNEQKERWLHRSTAYVHTIPMDIPFICHHGWAIGSIWMLWFHWLHSLSLLLACLWYALHWRDGDRTREADRRMFTVGFIHATPHLKAFPFILDCTLHDTLNCYLNTHTQTHILSTYWNHTFEYKNKKNA